MQNGCDHPDKDLTVTPSSSIYGGAEAYCSACGDRWRMTQQEFERYEASHAGV